MLTLDTSGILAAVNDADPHHAQAVSALHLDRGPFIIPTGILAEVAYMLEARLGTAVLDAFLADVQERAFILHCGEEDLPGFARSSPDTRTFLSGMRMRRSSPARNTAVGGC